MKKRPYQDQYVNVGGINTRFWQAGGKGKVVILLHGIMSSADIWRSNIPALAQHYRVYVPDLPGFGLTDKTPLGSLTQAARYIDNFMKTLGLDRAILIGNSLGGGMALQYTILYPDKVDRLVLVGSLGFGRKVHYLLKLLALPVIGNILTRPSRDTTRKYLCGAVYDPSSIPDELVETSHRFSALPGAQKALLYILRNGIGLRGIKPDTIRSITDNLHAVNTPAFIIWGENDPLFTVDQAYTALEKLPNARLEVFERCGHLPQLEYPDKFNSLVLEFLAK